MPTNLPARYLDNGKAIPYKWWDNSAGIETGGFPKIGEVAATTTTPSTPNDLDVLTAIKYRVGTGPVLEGYLTRDPSNPTDPYKIADTSLNPVTGATVVTDKTQDDVIRPLTYQVNGIGPELVGYELRDENNNLYIGDANYVAVNNAVEVPQKQTDVRRHEVYTLPSANAFTFTLAEMPLSTDLVEANYRGFNMINGTHFTVAGQTVDFSPAGLSISAGEQIDVYYEVPA